MLHQECSGMVELVCGLHHVSSGGDQGKFLSGGASAWTSPRESKGGGARNRASPWMSWSGEANDGVSLWKSKDGKARGWASPRMFH